MLFSYRDDRENELYVTDASYATYCLPSKRSCAAVGGLY